MKIIIKLYRNCPRVKVIWPIVVLFLTLGGIDTFSQMVPSKTPRAPWKVRHDADGSDKFRSVGPWGRPRGRVRPAILVLDNQRFNLLLMRRGNTVTVLTKGGVLVAGKIERINRDTLFLTGGVVTVAELDKLWQPRNPGPRELLRGELSPAYVADSGDWQIIIPPDSVFRYSGT